MTKRALLPVIGSLLLTSCGGSSTMTEVKIYDLGGELGAARVIEAAPADAAGTPRPRDDVAGSAGRLRLPVGTAVEYAVPGGGSAVWRADAVRGDGIEAGNRLELSVWAMPATLSQPIEQVTVTDLGTTPGEAAPEITFPKSRIGWRVRLEAVGTPGSLGAYQLQRARIMARSTPRERSRPPRTSPRDPRPNVLLYIVDTLRRDHLGVYGHPGARTPQIDRFALSATRFRRGEAHASWTRATVASLMTGLEPPIHATIDRGDGLPPDVPLLAEILSDSGFATKAVFTNSNAGPDAGFDRGFDHVDHLREEVTPEIHQPARRATELAIDWIEKRPTDRPFLLHLHVSDPHDPYLPPGRFRPHEALENAPGWLGEGRSMRRLERGEIELPPETLRQLEALYDGEIAALDDAFGLLLQHLVTADLWENTMILFVADHGEEFLDHGQYTHAKTLYAEMLSIPLIVKWPQGAYAGRTVESVARQIDLLPTILDAVGENPPPGTQGRNLRALALGETDFEPAFGYHDLGDNALRSVRLHDVKLIGRALPDRTHRILGLFDLAADPDESVDLSRKHPEWVSYLELLWLRQRRERRRAHEPTAISRHFEVQERLEALGYL